MGLVRVIYHHEPEGWWAESPDLAGWSVAGSSYREVRFLVVEGVPFALDGERRPIEHYPPPR
jgi:predicted RNase H-like HicB family nuclease